MEFRSSACIIQVSIFGLLSQTVRQGDVGQAAASFYHES